jgi:hypothetical protein
MRSGTNVRLMHDAIKAQDAHVARLRAALEMRTDRAVQRVTRAAKQGYYASLHESRTFLLEARGSGHGVAEGRYAVESLPEKARPATIEEQMEQQW